MIEKIKERLKKNYARWKSLPLRYKVSIFCLFMIMYFLVEYIQLNSVLHLIHFAEIVTEYNITMTPFAYKYIVLNITISTIILVLVLIIGTIAIANRIIKKYAKTEN